MIKKTFTLLKKDIMLLEAYSLLAILILLALPIFLNYSIKGIMNPIYLLFLSLDFCAFLVFGQIYLMESKYMGMSYLISCPFTRVQMIAARYILLLFICGLGAGCYKLLEFLNPLHLFSGPPLSIPQIVIAVSIVLIVYDVLIPILNNCAYEKVRVVHAILSVIIPVWGVILVRAILQYFHISLTIKEVSGVGIIILLLFDIILTGVSIGITKSLWEKKEF